MMLNARKVEICSIEFKQIEINFGYTIQYGRPRLLATLLYAVSGLSMKKVCIVLHSLPKTWLCITSSKI